MSDASPLESAGPRMLIACAGNIFLGDDGFGVAVAERLRDRRYPAGVHVEDFGIRGVELAYTLLDGYETLVLVDATPRGGTPGTLYLLELSPTGEVAEPDAATGGPALDGHSMDPMKVLAFARALGAVPRRVLLVGCEPDAPPSTDDEMRMGLSDPVRAVLDDAVAMIDRLVHEGSQDSPNNELIVAN